MDAPPGTTRRSWLGMLVYLIILVVAALACCIGGDEGCGAPDDGPTDDPEDEACIEP